MYWLKNKNFILIIAFAAFFLDRILKIMIVRKEGFFIIKDFLKINYYPNWGIALSIPVSQYIFYPLIIILLIIIFYYLVRVWRESILIPLWAMILIFTGAFSNLLDRFRYGHVVDYVNFSGWFPVFNLADIMIVAGTVLLMIYGIKKRSANDRSKNTTKI